MRAHQRKPVQVHQVHPSGNADALWIADQRMQQAKHRFSLAALACLRGAIDAPAQVQRALQEIDAARAALREASDAA